MADANPTLTARIDSEKSQPLAWKTVAKRAATVAVAGIAIYLVFPAITEVFASWPRLSTLNPWWITAAIAAEIAHFACTFGLQRMALRTRAWFPVVTSSLAGNAISLIMPGGAPVGAAVQFRMLAASGNDMSSTVGGLVAFSLLGTGSLLALPFFALPVILLGTPVSRGLVNTAILGAVGFVAFAAFGAVIMAYDAPLRWTGRAAQRLANWVRRNKPPLAGLDTTLLAQRDEIRAVLGKQWPQALLLTAGRLAFDFVCLLAALRATGSNPRPSLILVAYAVAGIIGMIPITPGGLGVVEASLTGLLVLAEVDSSQAVLATLAYRIASYWVPLLAGPVAYGLFRMRYRKRSLAPSPREGDDPRPVPAHDRRVSTPDDDELGPVDYLAVEFPGGRVSGSGFEQLLSLAQQGTIRILDAEFIVKDASGNARKAGAAELGGSAGADISAWAGASSGLLDDADVSHVSAAIQPGSAAAVIVYENRWILGLADAWRRDGARLIEDGGIPADDLVAALDATERS